MKYLLNFDTTNVKDMGYMFSTCKNLKVLKFEENFNTEKVTDMEYMFYKCNSFPEKIRNNLNDVKEVIAYFKKDK